MKNYTPHIDSRHNRYLGQALRLPLCLGLLGLSLSAFSLSSCGYAFQGSGSVLPQDVKTVAIPLSENNTTTPGLGQRFAEALRSRFDRYGAVKVVENESAADAILLSRIDDLETEVKDVTSRTDIEVESELVLKVSVELKKKNGQILYKNTGMSISDNSASIADTVVTSSSQFAQGGIDASTLNSLDNREVARGQRAQAVEDLLDEAARRVYLDAVAPDF